MDFIERPGASGSNLKESRLGLGSRACVRLVEESDAILVCKGLGRAVQPLMRVPTPPSSTCGCGEVPERRNLLVAHNWCLDRILRTKFGAYTTSRRTPAGWGRTTSGE
jgi:hypothetical protein